MSIFGLSLIALIVHVGLLFSGRRWFTFVGRMIVVTTLKLKDMRFYLCIGWLVCLSCLNLQAQNNRLEGRIVEVQEEKTLPMEAVSVSLLTPDSAFVSGCATDGKGKFRLDRLKAGNYILSASFLGYEPLFIAVNNLSGAVDLGDIVMGESSVELANVEVTASNIINQVDRQVILPTQSAVKHSADVYDLMNRLNIPRLYVDPVMKSMSVSNGGNIQTRINGIKVPANEFMSVLPKDILRIEYIEDPGSRYGEQGLGAVLNLVTRRRETGGYVALQASDSPHRLFGENFLTVKYNNRRSEWGLNVSNNNRGLKQKHRDMEETYYLEDETINRVREGIGDKMKSFKNDISLSYNLYNPDKYVFNAVFRNSLKNVPYNNLHNRLYDRSAPGESIYSRTLQGEDSYTPSLDLYFQYNLPKKQTLEFNVVGTLMSTNSERTYLEYIDADNPFTNLLTNVDGKKYSIIGEGIYTRAFEKMNFSAGLRHSQMKTENRYSGTTNSLSDMWQSETYGFAEIVGKVNKFSYTLGVGANRSWFKEGTVDNTYWIFTPTVRLGWQPHKNSFIRYTFQMNPSIPSLSSLTDVEVLLDTLQIVRGNPNLQTYKNFKNNLNISYNKGVFRSYLNLNHRYAKNPIMEDVFIEGNKVILTENNQDYFQQLDVNLNLGVNGVTIGPLPQFLSLYVDFGYSRYTSKGWNYKHTFDDFNFNINATLTYRNWALFAQYRRFLSSLYGETIQNGSDMSTLGLVWMKNNLQLGAFVLNPFTHNYHQGYERLSKYAPVVSWDYMKEMGQMAVLRLSYNFSFGRKHKAGDKRLNNADRDAGIINMDR